MRDKMQAMSDTISFTSSIDAAQAAAFVDAFTPTPEENEAELQRVLQASRLSGMEVVFDLIMFGDEWSPVFRHPGRDPIAWVSGDRRHEGAERPA